MRAYFKEELPDAHVHLVAIEACDELASHDALMIAAGLISQLPSVVAADLCCCDLLFATGAIRRGQYISYKLGFALMCSSPCSSRNYTSGS